MKSPIYTVSLTAAEWGRVQSCLMLSSGWKVETSKAGITNKSVHDKIFEQMPFLK